MASGGDYAVELTRDAVKDPERLNKILGQAQLRRLDEKIRGLAQDPRPPGSKKLSGGDGCRLRDGDYRILYDIDDAARRVVIARVLNRRDAYRP